MTSDTSSKSPALTRRDLPPRSISVVLPCYNEEQVLEELRRRVSGILQVLRIPYEIVFVDDGSSDSTWSMLCRFQRQDPHIKIVRLSRNYGHQVALTCGVDNARGQVVVIMDADLQDPPELLSEMIGQWQEGYDVVYGKRRRRIGESLSKRFFAFAFYRIISTLARIDIPRDTGDFRLMDRRAADAFRAMRENRRFIRGMISWLGFQQTCVEYDRPQRFAGETKYPFRKSLLLAIDAITSFSYIPLRAATFLGIAISGLAFFYILLVLVLNALGKNLPGYTSIMATMLILGGVQLIVLGIIGEYVGRVFEQTKMRPLYFIDKIEGDPLL